jgi:hypothetical protein
MCYTFLLTCSFFFFHLTMQTRLTSDLPSSSGWPWTPNPPWCLDYICTPPHMTLSHSYKDTFIYGLASPIPIPFCVLTKNPKVPWLLYAPASCEIIPTGLSLSQAVTIPRLWKRCLGCQKYWKKLVLSQNSFNSHINHTPTTRDRHA